MKVPDKIYMPNELLSDIWQRHIEGEDTAYICKDALLEWAKEMKKICKGAEPIEKAYQTVIEKIESL